MADVGQAGNQLQLIDLLLLIGKRLPVERAVDAERRRLAADGELAVDTASGVG
jgi:hypothetical protein